MLKTFLMVETPALFYLFFFGGNILSKLKIVLLLFFVLFAVSGCERITATVIPAPDTSGTQPFTVMTYNVYVGTGAEVLLSVQNLSQVPQVSATMYKNIIASDFPARATAIAKSIKTYQPHLVGLQEIALIRYQSPSDFFSGNPTLAETVLLDFLQILMDALQAEKLQYQVAAKVENLDIETPMSTDTGNDDVRLTDYDVILSRSDVDISNPMHATYANLLTIDKPGFVVVKRGYAAVDANVSGTTYRVFNTHLEPLDEQKRVAQTQELVDMLSAEPLPIILLGDFNTRAPNGTAYQLLLSAGYVDVWQMDSEGTGNTCCQDDDILNVVSDLTHRIDQIFVRNFPLPISVMTHTVGDKPSERLASGLWPSDHAGVVAQITLE